MRLRRVSATNSFERAAQARHTRERLQLKPKKAKPPAQSPPLFVRIAAVFLYQTVVRPVLVSREVKPLGLWYSRVVVLLDWGVWKAVRPDDERYH